jgi:hypothetical protein
LLGDAGKLLRTVALNILRHGKAEQFGDKVTGDAAVTFGEQRRGCVDQRHAGIVISAGGNILDAHLSPISLISLRY